MQYTWDLYDSTPSECSDWGKSNEGKLEGKTRPFFPRRGNKISKLHREKKKTPCSKDPKRLQLLQGEGKIYREGDHFQSIPPAVNTKTAPSPRKFTWGGRGEGRGWGKRLRYRGNGATTSKKRSKKKKEVNQGERGLSLVEKSPE